MNLSVLSWWGWLLGGAVALALGALVSDLKHPDSSAGRIVLGFLFILAAVVGFAQGIAGLIKAI